MPQADLHHYFEMVRNSEFYPGVRSQRLDHWLCANSSVGFRCLSAFFDYECRLIGARSARLCPAADVMRYFRFGYPAKPRAVFALTVGLEDPAPTCDAVDAFVRHEAELNGYRAELKEVWKYRMATFLYIIHSDSMLTIEGWNDFSLFAGQATETYEEAQGPNFTELTGADGTGDVCSSENIEHAAAIVGRTADIVVADGGFGVDRGPKGEHMENYQDPTGQ
eukprot:s2030_g8.t1